MKSSVNQANYQQMISTEPRSVSFLPSPNQPVSLRQALQQQQDQQQMAQGLNPKFIEMRVHQMV